MGPDAVHDYGDYGKDAVAEHLSNAPDGKSPKEAEGRNCRSCSIPEQGDLVERLGELFNRYN